MSRHTLIPIHPFHEVTVGWDHPLLTFFIIVKDKRIKDPDLQIVVWRGTKPREIYEVEGLLKIAVKYAKINPIILGSALYGDKDDGQ